MRISYFNTNGEKVNTEVKTKHGRKLDNNYANVIFFYAFFQDSPIAKLSHND